MTVSTLARVIGATPADLVTRLGTAGNGVEIAATLIDRYSPELAAILQGREHPELAAEVSHIAGLTAVAWVVGVDAIDSATVRIGRAQEPWVTFAWVDGRGSVEKGAFPHADLATGTTDRLLTQANSLIRFEARP